MDEQNPSDEIARIEQRLEELAEIAERCRKIMLVSKAAIAVGVVLPLLMMFGLFASTEIALGSIAAVLGGVVSLGSNVSTLRQTMDAISAEEALRMELIGGIHLRVVRDSPLKLV